MSGSYITITVLWYVAYPQKLIANYSIRGLAVARAGDRSYVTGLIHGWSRSHLTYILYRVTQRAQAPFAASLSYC